MELLTNFYTEVSSKKNDYSKSSYVLDVWLPEVSVIKLLSYHILFVFFLHYISVICAFVNLLSQFKMILHDIKNIFKTILCSIFRRLYMLCRKLIMLIATKQSWHTTREQVNPVISLMQNYYINSKLNLFQMKTDRLP